MKIKLLITALFITYATIPTFAGITPTDAVSPDYLRNHGHSNATVEIVQKTRASVNGEQYLNTTDAEQGKKDCKLVRWIKNVFIYLDPALDDGSFMNHDIKTTPSYEDL